MTNKLTRALQRSAEIELMHPCFRRTWPCNVSEEFRRHCIMAFEWRKGAGSRSKCAHRFLAANSALAEMSSLHSSSHPRPETEQCMGVHLLVEHKISLFFQKAQLGGSREAPRIGVSLCDQQQLAYFYAA
jgi:hypothetical protein